MLAIKSNNKFSVVSIEKWGDYQVEKIKSDNKRTTNEQQMNTNKNVKNVNNIYTSSNDDELKKHFDLIWEIYPNKQGKAKAEKYFLQWVKGKKINGRTVKLTDKQMYLAVKKYKKECEDKETEKQYIKHGSTFFNEAILDYVEADNE